MRIGRLFAASMLSVTALAVIIGGEVLVPQTRTLLAKSEAIKDVEAFGAVLAASQQVASYRAPYLSPLFQEGPATPAQLETIAKVTKAADAAFAKAKVLIGTLDDSSVLMADLDQAAAKLADLRARSDHAIAVPMSARDRAALDGFMPGTVQVIAAIEPILNRIETRVTGADASLTALLNVPRIARARGLAGGGRAGTLSAPIATRRPLKPAEFTIMDRNQGRIEVDRERIESDIDQLGNPARLAGVMKDAVDAYFGHAALVVDKELPAARSDGKYSITSDELASSIVPAV